jgi:hypothetical protein
MGVNGSFDYSANTYVRTEGGQSGSAAGPNTVHFTDVQFNQGGNSVNHWWEFVNLGSGGVPSIDATEFSCSDCHIENLTSTTGAVIYSDSSWNAIDRFAMFNTVVNAPNTPMFGLNAATALSEWDLVGDKFYVSTFTAAPTNGFTAFDWTGGRVTGTVSLTGASGSSASIANVTYGANVTVAGAWGAFSDIGSSFTSGSRTITATGNLKIDDWNDGRVVSINPASVPAEDYSGSQVTVAQGASVTIPKVSAEVIVDNRTGNGTAVYLTGGGGVAYIGASNATWDIGTTTPSSGKSSIGFNGSQYALYNNTGASVTYSLKVVKLNGN